eukprot:gene8641-17824_t
MSRILRILLGLIGVAAVVCVASDLDDHRFGNSNLPKASAGGKGNGIIRKLTELDAQVKGKFAKVPNAKFDEKSSAKKKAKKRFKEGKGFKKGPSGIFAPGSESVLLITSAYLKTIQDQSTFIIPVEVLYVTPTTTVSTIVNSMTSALQNIYGHMFSLLSSLSITGISVTGVGSAVVVPSGSATLAPTVMISKRPSNTPSVLPTTTPSLIPTTVPSTDPTYKPTADPTYNPSNIPTNTPSTDPTYTPTVMPTYTPSTDPTYTPTYTPTVIPTYTPSTDSTYIPTYTPSIDPTNTPTYKPSIDPTYTPSNESTYTPSNEPKSTPVVPISKEECICTWKATVAPNLDGQWPIGCTGIVPDNIASGGKLSKVAILHLYTNKLTGTISSELGTISLLTGFVLCSNKATGSIPTNFCTSNGHRTWAFDITNNPSPGLCYPTCLASQSYFNKGSATQCA